MAAVTDGSARQYVAPVHRVGCYGYIAPSFALAGIITFVCAASGVPLGLTLVIAAVVFAPGVHFIRRARVGGATVEGRTITLRGYMRSATVSVGEVESVSYKLGWARQPAGWLQLHGERQALLGVTVSHQHGVGRFAGRWQPRPAELCPECREQLRVLAALAADLGVPVVMRASEIQRWTGANGTVLPPL